MQDYPLEARTIGRLLADKARLHPARTFLRWQGRDYTYAELESLTNRYANGFTRRGIRHGDHVAVMLPNCPEFLWVVWGLGKLGAVAVPLNTAAKGDMLRYFVDQSDACCLVIDAQWLDRLGAVAGQLPKVRQCFVRDAAAPGADGGAAVGSTAAGGSAFDPLHTLEADDTSAPSRDAVRHDDTQFILYTSGTTGPSKGVMCPHSQSHAVGRALVQDFGYQPDDVLYTCLPLFHANAMNYTCYAALWADAAVALSPQFSASRFWDEVRDCGATQFNALGAMISILWKLPPGPGDRQHRVRLCMTVPVPRDHYHDIQQRYGFQITSVFGMSENYPITRFLADDDARKAGSAGRPLGACELRILDDENRPLSAGQVGELCMRSLLEGAMMKGYYNMPDKTAEAFHQGWFRTGDRAYVDDDGYLFFVDRKKEAIRRRGENISAFEVETILAKHPAIFEVAAVAVPAEVGEDDVMVYIALAPGSTMTHAEVVRFAAEHMSYFMVPRYVEFIDALPKTETEKVQKYKLKADAIARREQLWDRERAGVSVRR